MILTNRPMLFPALAPSRSHGSAIGYCIMVLTSYLECVHKTGKAILFTVAPPPTLLMDAEYIVTQWNKTSYRSNCIEKKRVWSGHIWFAMIGPLIFIHALGLTLWAYTVFYDWLWSKRRGSVSSPAVLSRDLLKDQEDITETLTYNSWSQSWHLKLKPSAYAVHSTMVPFYKNWLVKFC